MCHHFETAHRGMVMCFTVSAEHSQGRGTRVVMKSSCAGLLSVSCVNIFIIRQLLFEGCAVEIVTTHYLYFSILLVTCIDRPESACQIR